MANRDQHSRKPAGSGSIKHCDAVVIGAGFGGLYALHHLRKMGLAVRVYDGAGGVGGTSAAGQLLTNRGSPHRNDEENCTLEVCE